MSFPFDTKELLTCKYCNKLVDESKMKCPCWKDGNKEACMRFLVFESHEEYYKALNDGYYIEKENSGE